MTVQRRPLADVTRQAIEILTRELGAVDTLRFVNQFTTGLGDYTAEREPMFADETLEQIIGAIKAKTPKRTGKPASSKKSKTRKRRDR
jgi:hypothetical protein